MKTGDLLILLNPWWKDKKVSSELAKPFKRKQFKGLLDLLGYRQMVIITGLRRTGKSTLMYQLIDFLLKKVEESHVVYFNFDKKTEHLTDILKEYEEITGVDWKKEKVFLFLDEVVKLDNWASKVKLVYDAFPNVKFVVSASASVKLEKEAMNILGGRHFLVKVNPLDFREFLALKGKKELIKKPLLWKEELRKESEEYLMKSFPEIVDFKDELKIKEYLQSIVIDRIIKEDVLKEFKGANSSLLSKLLNLLYSEPGVYVNYDNIAKQLGVSKKTLYLHMECLEFTYLIRMVKNYRVNSFSESRKLQRAYAYWWNTLYSYSDNNDKIMENVVCSYKDLNHYWRQAGKEVDFLELKNHGELMPIEVKNKEKIKASDIKTLKYFLSKYGLKKGVVVYKGEEEKTKKTSNGEQITFIPLWKWLLKEK